MKLTYGPLPEAREWDRRDPSYDIRPLGRDDLGTLILMVPAAIVVIAALLAFCGLLIALVPGPTQ